MAEVAIAVAMTAAVSGAGVAVGAVTAQAALTAIVTTAATAGLSYALKDRSGNEPAPQAPTAAPGNTQRNIPVAQATPNRRYVYGVCRTAGAMFLYDNVNPKLYQGVALSDGTIGGIDMAYFGANEAPFDGAGNALSSSKYSGRFSVSRSNGGDAQTADAVLLSKFPALTSDFRQLGVARVVSTIDWGADATQHNGLWGDGLVPSFLVRGVLVYDPRTPGASATDPATWAYSDNPALCVAHALMNVWGSPIAAADIDWPSVIAAANICDATVSHAGSAKKTFVLAGVFEAGSQIAQQVVAMLGAMDGGITFADGKYSIHADAAASSVWEIIDDDVHQWGDFRNDVPAADVYGSIDCDYFDAGDAGQRQTSPVYTMDAGRKTSIKVPFCSAGHSAQILAYRALVKSREPRALTVTLSDAALWLTPFKDVVTINSKVATFANGLYRVEQVDLVQDGVAVRLRGYSSAAYVDPAGYLQ